MATTSNNVNQINLSQNTEKKIVKQVEDDTVFEEFEECDWEAKQIREELDFNEWNQNIDDYEDMDNIEKIIKEEILNFKANNINSK